jgi:hypothetical protein
MLSAKPENEAEISVTVLYISWCERLAAILSGGGIFRSARCSVNGGQLPGNPRNRHTESDTNL